MELGRDSDTGGQVMVGFLCFFLMLLILFHFDFWSYNISVYSSKTILIRFVVCISSNHKICSY